MTRGTLILITDTNAYESVEYNGDMYFDGHGEEVVRRFKSPDVKTRESFDEMLTLFNAKNFGYPHKECQPRPLFVSETMDLRNNYIKNWFSDYLYIKNASSRDIHIKCKDEDDADLEYILQPKEIAWFCFGHFCASVMEDDDLDAEDNEYVFSELEMKELEDALRNVKKDMSTIHTILRNLEHSAERIENILGAVKEKEE